MAIQKLLHAARQGVPCLYVSLELTEAEVTLRLLAQVAGVSWSRAMRGRLTDSEFLKFQNAYAELSTLPISIARGHPYSFSSADLVAIVTDFRRVHADGSAYVEVDFAQLMKGSQQNSEARERLGQVLYGMQTLAKSQNITITAISSTARANNSPLANIKMFANLKFEDGEKIVGNPMALLALGKESGEIELAAEYQLVLAKWPGKLATGEEILIGAFAKYRLNRCRWFAMIVRQGRLIEFPCTSWDDLPVLPEATEKGAIKDVVLPDEYERRILDYVSAHPDTVKSKTGFRGLVSGKKEEVDAAAERLIARDAIIRGPSGGFVINPDRDSK